MIATFSTNMEILFQNQTCLWAKWMENWKQRRLAEDKLPDGTRISTVFLGLDHSFGGHKPVLWETMIFGGEHNEFQERYTSREDALAGHAIAMSMAKGK